MLLDKWVLQVSEDLLPVDLKSSHDLLNWCEAVCTFLAQDECASDLLRVPGGPPFVTGHLRDGTIGSALAAVFHALPLPTFTSETPILEEPAWVLPVRTVKWSPASRAVPLKTTGPLFFSQSLFDDGDTVVSSLDTVEPSVRSRRPKTGTLTSHPRLTRQKKIKEWMGLLDILEAKPVMDMPAKEAELLQWIEDFGEQYEQGSLECWTLNRICQLLERSKDDTLGVIEAIEAVLAGFRKLNPGPKSLLIGQANITSYRSEVRTWLLDRDESIWLLQETHVPESGTKALVNKFQSVGRQTWVGPAALTQGGSSGGLLTLAPSHRNAATGPAFMSEGKGFVSVSIRFQGWDLLLVNLYLQSGVGPTGGLNPEILSRLAAVLDQTSTQWLVLGDWNCSPSELLRLGFVYKVKGQVVAPSGPTINTGGTLDYAVASKRMAPLLSVASSWDVPFKPHCAVTVELRVGVADLPVRQLKGFPLEPTALCPDELSMPEVQPGGFWDWSRPIDYEWASFTAGVEEQLFSVQAGRGWKLEVSFSPLVKTTSPEKLWKGSSPAFWQSFLTWTSKALGTNPDPRITPLFVEAKNRIPEFWSEMASCTAQALQDLLGAPDMQSHHLALEIIAQQGRSALKEAVRKSDEAYSQWLEEACKGGMRGLYKALKSEDSIPDRPYRNIPLEIRPHIRRAHWADVWQPMPGNEVNPNIDFDSLRDASVSQAKTLPPITGPMVAKVIKRMPTKAIGADGWSVQMLKCLAPLQLERLAQFFNTWEGQGAFPTQLSVVLVALINKSEDEERPIGLTPVPYRLWAKIRWPVFEEWLREYAATQDWDRAKKGLSSLDVALRRKLSHEILHRKKRHSVTVLLDLKAFYENVRHDNFVNQAISLKVPPLILNAAMSLYSAQRLISAEHCVSGPIKPTKGLVAGCPFAPGLSKIPFDEILRPAWVSGLAKTIDLYIDDTSFDTEAGNPHTAARRAVQLYKAVVGGLTAAGLPVSLGKTAFVCSSPKVEAALKEYLPESDQIKNAAKDLGIDCTAGRRRRIPFHRKRFGKGVKRKARLSTLRVKSMPARVRALRAGVQTVGLYGHEAVGLAPKRMHWLRASFAHELGRMSLGSVDITIDHACPKRPDPAFTIISQHFKAIHRLLGFIPDSQRQHFDDVLPGMWLEYSQVEYPWKRAAGPVGALLCYLLDLGWTPVSADTWKCPEQPHSVTAKVGMHHLLCSLSKETDRWRLARIAQHDMLEPLSVGIDWVPLRKLRNKMTGQERSGLMAVWQGAIRADPCATCLRCGCAATMQHVLWECDWWRTNLPEPASFPRFRQEWPISSLWARGLLPTSPYPDDGEWVRTTGAWCDGQVICGEAIYFATDGSPGKSKDPRFHRYTWAAIAFKLEGDEPVTIATAVGSLQSPLSVFRAKAAAVKFVAEHSEGNADLTLDCKGILPRVNGTPSIQSADLFDPIRLHAQRLSLNWVSSHLTEEQFRAKFGANQLWRRRANEIVDQLVGTAAEARRDLNFESQIKKRDAVAIQVNTLLAKRAAALLSYDKDQGPLVQPDKEQRKLRQKPRVRDSGVLKNSKLPKIKGPNKREQIEGLLAGTQNLGHTWVEGCRLPSNLSARCSRCELYIQQTEPLPTFSLKIKHPCLGVQADPPPWDPHPDHVWVNLGKSWVCSKCDKMVKVGVRKIPTWIVAPCRPTKSKVATASSKKAKEVTDTGVQSVRAFFVSSSSQEPSPKISVPKPKPKSKAKQSGLKQAKIAF